MNNNSQSEQGRILIRLGIVLFFLGLVTGFLIPLMINPRVGLSGHLEGIMNGMLLIIFGLIWPKLRLQNKALRWTYILALYGAFTNWFTTLLAGLWGAGAGFMPSTGNNMVGNNFQEFVIGFGLISLSIAMLIVCILIFIGMRGKN
ncbi:MAG: hydrogenase [Ignavibacteriaceae bacterium]